MVKTPTDAKTSTAAKTAAKPRAKSVAKSDAAKRDALRDKIAHGERRNAQRGFADGAIDYVKANPLKSMAGVAIGALLIGAMTRRGRKAGKKAGALAGVATEAALAYGLGLLETAGNAASKGQDRLADLGGTVGEKARVWQSTAAKEGSALSDYLLDAAKRSGKRAGKTIDELRSRIQH